MNNFVKNDTDNIQNSFFLNEVCVFVCACMHFNHTVTFVFEM